MRRLLLPAALVLLVACARGPASDSFPKLEGSTLDGGKITQADYRGKVMLVNAWASWCNPCRREMPALQRLHQRFGARVYFLGVNERDNHASAVAFVRHLGVTYPSIEDPAGAWADDFGWVGLPDTYLVDRAGTIRYRIAGLIDEREVAGLLEKMLGPTG